MKMIKIRTIYEVLYPIIIVTLPKNSNVFNLLNPNDIFFQYIVGKPNTLQKLALLKNMAMLFSKKRF